MSERLGPWQQSQTLTGGPSQTHTGKSPQTYLLTVSRSKLSPALCQDVGGHCWKDTTEQIVYTTTPPQYPPPERTCKHCGKRQVGTPQEAVKWEDQG